MIGEKNKYNKTRCSGNMNSYIVVKRYLHMSMQEKGSLKPNERQWILSRNEIAFTRDGGKVAS
jgi:hypothetical protein